MARSSGARPKKAVKAEVDALKKRLGTITSDRWVAAQAVFDKICALCDVVGPSGGQMVPRACRVCGYFGHTRQYCPEWLARRAAMSDRELEEVLAEKAAGYRTPQSLEESESPEQWKWICELNAIEECVEKGKALGRGGCKQVVRSAHKINLRCNCTGCIDWQEYMREEGFGALGKAV